MSSEKADIGNRPPSKKEEEPAEESSDSEMEMAESPAEMNGCESGQNSDHVKSCLKSRRVLQHDELLRISKNIGANWRQVGNALKFNFKQLDVWESEGQNQSDSVYKMLQEWLAWKEEKATASRMAKALYLNQEWEAIDCLCP